MKASETQIGGTHYCRMKIQPHEFAHANEIGFHEASAIAYLCRWKAKNGVEDLRKAVHIIELLIELEEAAQAQESTQDVPRIPAGEGVLSYSDLPRSVASVIQDRRQVSHAREG